MTRNKLEQMWDDSRDGELSEAERKAFDEAMLDDRDQAARWGAESRWLGLLKSIRPGVAAPEEPTFTQRVLEQWDDQRKRTGFWGSGPRLAMTLGGWSLAAAAVALVIWLNPPLEQEPGAELVQDQPRQQHDPVTVLIQDMTEQYQQRPSAVFDVVRDTRSVLSLHGAMRLLGMPQSPPDAPPPSTNVHLATENSRN